MKKIAAGWTWRRMTLTYTVVANHSSNNLFAVAETTQTRPEQDWRESGAIIITKERKTFGERRQPLQQANERTTSWLAGWLVGRLMYDVDGWTLIMPTVCSARQASNRLPAH